MGHGSPNRVAISPLANRADEFHFALWVLWRNLLRHSLQPAIATAWVANTYVAQPWNEIIGNIG